MKFAELKTRLVAEMIAFLSDNAKDPEMKTVHEEMVAGLEKCETIDELSEVLESDFGFDNGYEFLLHMVIDPSK